MGKKIRKPKLLLLSFAIVYFYSWYLVKNDYSKYSILKTNGEIAECSSKFVNGKLYDQYHFSFETLDGKVISENGKCDLKKFEDYYANLQVIYYPKNPFVYMEKPNFDNFSLGYLIFFYFGLVGSFFATIIYKALIEITL